MKARNVYVKLPGNKVKLVRKKSNPAIAKCGICGNYLHGIPRLKIGRFKNLPKSKKRPNRPYGGNLCSRCMREEIARRAGGQNAL